MKLDYAILSLCANLGVSPSGYYDWQKRRATPGPRAVETDGRREDRGRGCPPSGAHALAN
jgi:hypothetical protein